MNGDEVHCGTVLHWSNAIEVLDYEEYTVEYKRLRRGQ